MVKLARKFAVLLVIVMFVAIIPAGCSNTSTETVKPAETATVKPSETPTAQPEERIKLRMFMTDSGTSTPQGIDHSNNEFLKIIEDYANVDIEMEVPSYPDFKTKLQLLLASGNLPDLVDNNYPEEMVTSINAGAFIDLRPYYDKSEQIQKVITPNMMELAKHTDGKNYRIPMAYDQTPQGQGNWIRYDLLQKLNDGKYPQTVDEYIAFLKKVKQTYPDSTPLTGRTQNNKLFVTSQVVFNWYGVASMDNNNYGFRVQNGKVISNFELPEFRAAVALMRNLHKEGILDQEFVTNDNTKFLSRIQFNNVAMHSNTADQLLGNLNETIKQKGNEDYIFTFTPPLAQYPSELKDIKYTYGKQRLPIAKHGLYIPKSCKVPDRVFRVIEGFASQDLYEAIFWGKEGSEYTVSNGKRIPNAAKLNDPNRTWSLQLALIFGYVSGQDAKQAVYEQTLGADRFKLVKESMNMVADEAVKKGGIGIYMLLPMISGVTDKIADSTNFISQATSKAIMGQITMEDFDKLVQQYNKEFGFIDEAFTKYMNENKETLKKKGCIEVDW